ncbi:PREDICTED: protein I'm not dead yet-like, partial [Ceratosolen solmsi marchali]|uniref:Protein I'm not dead yet-like n=1 Tax=Ceratosolen solmsi marchali TaxID=326594 RepID=A0AAJ6VNT8_9HYME
LQFVKIYWKTLIIIIWPLVLIPVLITYDSPEMRCGIVILLMAMFWVTEALPMGITSLIPLVLFPALNVLSSQETCICYMNDTIMVFFGGLVVAIAIENSKLHMRIALGVMKFVGCSHRRLLAGLLVVTTLLGMWISNSACTALMVPIIFTVLQELEKEGLTKVFIVKENSDDPENDKRPSKITKAYLLATAYSATFGGTTTLVGTGTNLTFKGIFETFFPRYDGISFTRWMIFGTPQAIVQIFITYLYMLTIYMGLFRPNSKDAQEARIGIEGQYIANRVIEEKYNSLGKMSWHEHAVSFLFFLCALLWFFRKPGFIMGWSDLIDNTTIKDSAPVLLIVILMFVVPKEPRFLNAFHKDANKRPITSSEGLITWKMIESKMPWSLMFLLGSGFAISKGSNTSCLAKKVGQLLIPLKNYPPILVLFLTLLFISSITEFTSNIGIANIVLPVIAQMSVSIKIDPLYLMIPSTIICSYAFRLPFGTPPNAIVTMAGHIPVTNLMFTGCGSTIYSLIVLIIMFPTYGVYIYKISGFPDWANPEMDPIKNMHC